jgi:hypothetical protein
MSTHISREAKAEGTRIISGVEDGSRGRKNLSRTRSQGSSLGDLIAWPRFAVDRWQLPARLTLNFLRAPLVRTPRFIRRITKFLKRTVHTLRLPGHTNLPPVMNQLMRERNPSILRNDLHQVLLHLLRSCLLGQLQPPRQPHNMRIDHDPRGNPVPRPQHYIPGLPRHPRQRKNLLHRLRNLPLKLLRNHPRRTLNRLCLVPKKSCSPNQFLELGKGSRGHCLRCRKRLEQLRCYQIHANIRTLRRQNRRNRQLPRILMIQRANHIRIRFPQRIENRSNALGRSLILCSSTWLFRCSSFNRFCRHHLSLPVSVLFR